MGIILGANQYGKAEIRVVKIDRDTPRHEIHDLSVTTTLRADFAAAHESGDQANGCPPTARSTVFAFAKQYGVDQIEDFALDLARHFVETVPAVTSARVGIDAYAWDRVGRAHRRGRHDHAVRRGQHAHHRGHGRRDRARAGRVGRVRDQGHGGAQVDRLEFRGFFAARFTTLAETDDRILATSLIARWRFGAPAADWAACHAGIRALLLDAFAGTHSRACSRPCRPWVRRC